jgi:membrane protein implicated in regulation of membrane protease activity
LNVSLEAAYWLLLGVGLGLLVLSLLLGDLFDFLDFIDLDFLGGDISLAPVFFTAMSAFGGGGLLGVNAFGLGAGASLITGLVAALLLGGLAGVLFAALQRQEAGEGFVTEQLIGARGRCTLALGPDKVGRVSITHAGMTRSFSATSDSAIAAGTEVVVTDTIGNALTVAPATKPSTQS